MNAVLYMTKTGCQWRMLPNDFPIFIQPYGVSIAEPINQVLWDRILLAFVQKKRLIHQKQARPTYAIIDSQSVKTQLLAHMIKVLMEVKKSKVVSDI